MAKQRIAVKTNIHLLTDRVTEYLGCHLTERLLGIPIVVFCDDVGIAWHAPLVICFMLGTKARGMDGSSRVM